ncbi:MAG: DEAD/DEAH box helicase [Victivallaceae bacterium]|nr:DEAD/DEAH box helicase [Victivallaceae bacterium]
MFDFLKKLFAAPAAAPAKEPRKAEKPPKKKKQSLDTPDAPRREEKKKNEEKKHRAKGGERKSPPPSGSADIERMKTRPQCPETLKDVPPMEGRMRFLDLDLPREIQFGLQNLDFEYCTPIQAMTLPRLLEGKDLAGKAQTGTGKTAAFLLSAFSHMLKHPLDPAKRRDGAPRMLVLAPTRELAIQIYNDAEAIAVFSNLKIAVVFGGMDHEKQRRSLQGPVDLVVGTPGRIIDFSRGGDLKLGDAEILVIDEADRMLDMGFIPDVRRIVGQLPPKGVRHTMLFSATLEERILHLASSWLSDPLMLESEPEKLVGDKIEQVFYTVTRDEKLPLLWHIINSHKFDRMLIFGNRKDVNLRLQSDLERLGLKVPLLSGDVAQDKRIKILDRFRSGEEKIVIATDVAARGIHVDDIELVVNFDLPEQPEDYVHRIGRTGRAGKSGKAVSFLCEYGAYNLPPIEELLGVKFKSILPDEELVTFTAEEKELLRARRAERPAREDFNSRRPHSPRRGPHPFRH